MNSVRRWLDEPLDPTGRESRFYTWVQNHSGLLQIIGIVAFFLFMRFVFWPWVLS